MRRRRDVGRGFQSAASLVPGTAAGASCTERICGCRSAPGDSRLDILSSYETQAELHLGPQAVLDAEECEYAPNHAVGLHFPTRPSCDAWDLSRKHRLSLMFVGVLGFSSTFLRSVMHFRSDLEYNSTLELKALSTCIWDREKFFQYPLSDHYGLLSEVELAWM